MSGSFPPSKPDWCNLDVIHRNTLPPRSYFFLYDSEEDALSADIQRSCSLKLSGTWKFHHANSPYEAPEGFENPSFNISKWSDIQVPGMWQLQGFAKPHYTNVIYPFFVDPPHVPFENNQTGSYVRKFRVPQSFADQQLRLQFEGVDSAFHVYVNGNEVGYSQGARNPSEFDVTSFVDVSGENTLAVRVYQFCDGSYLEDQDQWWLSGIFRDVYLHAFPKSHIQDLHIQTQLDDRYQDADLDVNILTNNTGNLSLKLLNANDDIITTNSMESTNGSTKLTIHVQSPQKWTAETPYLYKAVVGFSGKFLVQNIGFRRIEIKDGIYLINGKRVVFRGANRHEHHPLHGRAVPYDFMKNDLLLMKKHNLNALRTCHQPSDPRLYDLADKLGLWIMDEADLECHGFGVIDESALPYPEKTWSFEKRKALVYGKSGRWTSDNPEWKAQYVDRAHQVCMRDKNHPSVVMWSLGNEAFYGCNFQSMYDEIKKIDQTRPIHYEGDFEAQTVDLFSRMYSSVDEIIKFGAMSEFSKPFVLCEFVHAMGNGPGNIKEYVDTFYRYPRLQGGWVWEWANHGLLTKNDLEEEYYGFGGDFGDQPNDRNFVMDGVLFSNHTPAPGLIEYTKAIEPVQVPGIAGDKIRVVNRYDFINLDHLECELQVVNDGARISLGEIAIPAGIGPHEVGELSMSDKYFDSYQSETYLQLDFRLRKATGWAEAGHVVASSQLQVHPPSPRAFVTDSSKSVPSISASITEITIKSQISTWILNLISGKLTSWRKGDTELFQNSFGPELDFYRALTDNDRPQDGREWREAYLHMTSTNTRSVKWTTDLETSSIKIIVSSRIAAPVLSWSIDTETAYTFTSSGALHVKCKGIPQGMNLPPTLARIGFTFAMPMEFDHVSWFGRGPGESYKDKKLSQHFGNWETTVDDLFVDYEFPQETSNRTDVRWVKFSSLPRSSPVMEGSLSETATGGASGAVVGTATDHDNSNSDGGSEGTSLTAHFGTQEGFSFMASHYTTVDLDESTHPYELHKRKKDHVIVRLDADHHGLGTGSCGPKTLPQYALYTKPFEFEIDLE